MSTETLSPGITISTPCASFTVPVTSVVVSVPHVGGDTGNLAQASISAIDGPFGGCPTPVWVVMKNGSGTLENHPLYLVFN